MHGTKAPRVALHNEGCPLHHFLPDSTLGLFLAKMRSLWPDQVSIIAAELGTQLRVWTSMGGGLLGPKILELLVFGVPWDVFPLRIALCPACSQPRFRAVVCPGHLGVQSPSLFVIFLMCSRQKQFLNTQMFWVP